MTRIESAPGFVAPPPLLVSIAVTSEPPGLDGVFGMWWLRYRDGSERYVPLRAARSSDTFLWEQFSHGGDSAHIYSGRTQREGKAPGNQLRGRFNCSNLILILVPLSAQHQTAQTSWCT